MPKVTVTVPHSHPPDEVVQRAGPYIEKIVDDFQGSDLEIEWVDHKADFSFTSLTFTIKGNVDVTPEDLTVIVELPFAAMIFKDKVEKALNKNLTRAVSDDEAPDGEG